MFQFTGSPHVTLWIYVTLTRVFRAGFPHSDIRGSRCICHSPRLFAACHVFHRLLVPRHPPCALTACPASAIHLAINKWPLKSLLNSFLLRKEKNFIAVSCRNTYALIRHLNRTSYDGRIRLSVKSRLLHALSSKCFGLKKQL